MWSRKTKMERRKEPAVRYTLFYALFSSFKTLLYDRHRHIHIHSYRVSKCVWNSKLTKITRCYGKQTVETHAGREMLYTQPSSACPFHFHHSLRFNLTSLRTWVYIQSKTETLLYNCTLQCNTCKRLWSQTCLSFKKTPRDSIYREL